MPKRPIREQLLAARRHCSAETCLSLSLLIQARFLGGDAYRQAGCISLYSPFLNEVQTELVARHCLTDGKRLAYPRVAGEALQFVEVSGPDELVAGDFGIPAPAGERVLTLDDLDLVVMPGVAFDAAGYRLGYGRGYYDRTLSGCPAKLERIGFAYEFQLVECLPAADHDCRLTQLVTEQRTLRFVPLGQADH
jgi:5-formyltetrahydrofolate cyclo-ligase